VETGCILEAKRNKLSGCNTIKLGSLLRYDFITPSLKRAGKCVMARTANLDLVVRVKKSL
jgi:hypothetical protein